MGHNVFQTDLGEGVKMSVSGGVIGMSDVGVMSDTVAGRLLDSRRMDAVKAFGGHIRHSPSRRIETYAIQPGACILPVINRRTGRFHAVSLFRHSERSEAIQHLAGSPSKVAGNGAGRQRSGFATVIGDPPPRCETPRS